MFGNFHRPDFVITTDPGNYEPGSFETDHVFGVNSIVAVVARLDRIHAIDRVKTGTAH